VSYSVAYSPEAEDDLAKLPPLVASFVLDEIDRLATDPVRLSRPAHFPYPPAGQAFHCGPYEHDGVHYWFYVSFRYAREESIHVEFIATSASP
jgi:hypothetical protein